MTAPRLTLAATLLAGTATLALAQHQHGAGQPPPAGAQPGPGLMQGMGPGMMGQMHGQDMSRMMEMMRSMMPMMERMQRMTPEERARMMEQMAPMMREMMPMMQGMMGQAQGGTAPDAHGHGGASGAAAQAPSTKAFQEAAERMHRDMAVQFAGNPDVDFARAMIPHHQGAIEMARIALQYGKDSAVKRLAESVIREQEREITELRDWLSKNAN